MSVGVSAMIANGRELLVALDVFSVICTVPAVSREVGTVPDKEASDCVPVGARAVLPNWMVPPVRPEPLTARVNCAPFALTEVGETEEICGPLNEKLFRSISQAPRPCVAARSVRDAW